jgi:hypothetical protein
MLWRRKCSTCDSLDNSEKSSLPLISLYDVGCSESTEVLENAPGSLGRARSLGREYFDPPRECIDHYQDMGVAPVIDWKRTDVVYV